ncbi:succinylglutamate desuccinylase [Allohahella marinimesophila]|uniref:Succinylglutamate desuccinylase n=1 Tax=Allohahella marinimesophila TaxID=1054972 RepID=A0ABP7PPR7_9GAMM
MPAFLSAALKPFASSFRWQGHGILEWTPPESLTATQEIFVISAGIHGNETAPVELLDQLVDEFVQSEKAAAPCLFLLGNLEAMQTQQRFIGTNLNRLFGPDSESAPIATGNTAAAREQHRARTLQLAVRCFQARHSDRLMIHLDLHTAIRRSEFTRFAILPPENDPSERLPDTALLNPLLVAAGMQACVRHQESGSTFSGWTAREFRAVSATLELGQVQAFGENDLSVLDEIRQTMSLCCSAEARQGRSLEEALGEHPVSGEMISFAVHHEIVRQTSGFTLHLADDVANFQRLPEGMRLYSDADQHYEVDHPEARILFPNAKVEIGHRAGLIVIPADSVTRPTQAN